MKKQLLLISAMVISMFVMADDRVQINGLWFDNFNTNAKTCRFSANWNGTTSTYTGSIDIPQTVEYNGSTYTVTWICSNAFYYSGVTSVYIPKTIKSFNSNAFYNAPNLKAIVSAVMDPSIINIYDRSQKLTTNNFSSVFNLLPDDCVLVVPAGTENIYSSCGWTSNTFKGGVYEGTLIMADNKSMTYGSSKPTLTYTRYTVDDIIYGVPELSCSATSSSPVGSYPIVVNSGTISSSSVVQFKNGTMTINPKNVSSFTISSIAAVTYNGLAQTPAITVKDGSKILTRETDYTVDYSNNKNAGTATVTVTGEGNYTGTKKAYFTINKAPLTITAKDYTINEKEDFPTFDATYSGFKNGQSNSVLTTQPTFSCSAADTETPGTYTITPSDATAQNYDISYVPGTLTINAVESVSISMATSSGVAREMIGFSSKYSLDFTNVPNLRAYTIVGYEEGLADVMGYRVYEVPPYTGIVIKTDDPGIEVDVPISTKKWNYANFLKPVVEQQTVNPTETIDGEDYTNFMVGKLDNGEMGFARVKNATTTQNKCYLPVLSSFYETAPARQAGGFGIVFIDNEETDINAMLYHGQPTNGNYYDLQGRKVKPVSKGLYIHNGKKVFVK